MAGPLFLGDLHTKPSAECHLVFRGVLDGQQRLVPGGVVQSDMHSGDYTGVGIFDQEDHRPSDDLPWKVLPDKIEVRNGGIDLYLFRGPADRALRFSGDSP